MGDVKLNLFDIDSAKRQIIEEGLCFDEETGEVYWTADDLEKLNQMEENKLEFISLMIKEKEAMANAIKTEQDALAKRKKSCEAKANALKKYVTDYLIASGKDNYETPKVKLSFRKSQTVDVFDADALLAYINKSEDRQKQFLKYKDPEISKSALKDALKADEQLVIPGAHMVTNANLQIK